MIINDKYKVEAIDDRNVCLLKKRIGKEDTKRAGEIIWEPVAYCKNVIDALKTLIDKETNGTGIIELETVVNKINELRKDINKLSEENLKFESEEN